VIGVAKSTEQSSFREVEITTALRQASLVIQLPNA
jgi:hypothetical protein